MAKKKEIVKAVQDPLGKYFHPDGALKNERHELWANHYVQCFAKAEAAINAGLVPPDKLSGAKDVAHKICRRPEVKKRVRVILAERVSEIGISEEWVIVQLATVVERAMASVEKRDRDGNPLGVYEFDGRNANRALELIGNHLGMFKKDDSVKAGQVVINLDFGEQEHKKVQITRAPINGELA
jgi:phage terminase small subunit